MAIVAGTPTVLFVTQYYRPEAIGSGPFCGDVAEAFVQRGWRVRALTARPHYPDGAVFPDYRRGALDHQQLYGVDIHRVPTLVFAAGSALHRIVSETYFLLRGMLATARFHADQANIVISLCPSILACIVGARCRRNGARHVALVHDIQSGLARGLGMTNGLLPRILQRVERSTLNGCDLVIVLSEDMRAYLLQIGVVSPIHVLPIWTDTSAIRPQPVAPGLARIALYSGNFGRKQGLMQLVDLADVLRGRGSTLKVVLRGRGSQKETIRRAIEDRSLRNVSFRDLLDADRLGDGLAEGDVHLVPQDPAAADYSVPSKIYSIMAAARPFVATARPNSTLWRLQQECGAFICVPPNQPESFADAVLRLAENESLRREMGIRGHQYVEAHCSKDRSLARLVSAVEVA